jgi:hypothetical protein
MADSALETLARAVLDGRVRLEPQYAEVADMPPAWRIVVEPAPTVEVKPLVHRAPLPETKGRTLCCARKTEDLPVGERLAFWEHEVTCLG